MDTSSPSNTAFKAQFEKFPQMHLMENRKHCKCKAGPVLLSPRPGIVFAQFPGTWLWIALHSLQSKAHGFAKDYLDPGRGEHINALAVRKSL